MRLAAPTRSVADAGTVLSAALTAVSVTASVAPRTRLPNASRATTDTLKIAPAVAPDTVETS